jgi:folate-dependent phosphoribosylglycinamide formyltransferase PurN
MRPIAVASAGFVRQIMLRPAFLGKFSYQILGVHGSWLPAITEVTLQIKFGDIAA